MKNATATNVISTASINSHGKKVRDCYTSDTVLLVIMLLLIITIICYHYVKQNGAIEKMENNEIKKWN